jgi:NADH:ubiquinone oxidoreductase subunit 5 (subunit L)/multisubunit Na+/H+ antiporter MnhA subunit
VGLAAPEAWPYALAACLAYAVHHGLAKGALFLGVGVVPAARTRAARWAAMGGLAFAALAVAGAPLTSGSVAKTALKEAALRAPEWPIALDLLLPLAAVGTTLLMGRFLMLVWWERPAGHGSFAGLAGPWAVLLAAVAGVMWVVPGRYELEAVSAYLPGPAAAWLAVWPVVAGAVLLWVLVQGARRLRVPAERVAVTPGDLLVPLERGLARARRAVSVDVRPIGNPVIALAALWHGVYAASGRTERLAEVERGLTRWGVASGLFVLLAAAFAAILVVAGGR